MLQLHGDQVFHCILEEHSYPICPCLLQWLWVESESIIHIKTLFISSFDYMWSHSSITYDDTLCAQEHLLYLETLLCSCLYNVVNSGQKWISNSHQNLIYLILWWHVVPFCNNIWWHSLCLGRVLCPWSSQCFRQGPASCYDQCIPLIVLRVVVSHLSVWCRDIEWSTAGCPIKLYAMRWSSEK
jgi:hypothetical protein